MLAAGLVLWFWLQHPDPAYWKDSLLQLRDWLEENPWALVLALATLPGVGFPISILLVLFGLVLGPRYGLFVTCIIAITAQSLCSLWTYLLAAGPLHKLLRQFVMRNRELPDFKGANALRITAILRITPGIPYALQNIALGILHIQLKPYLLVSIPIQSLYTVGFVVTGGALFTGQTGLAITAFLCIVMVVLATRMIRSRNSKHAA